MRWSRIIVDEPVQVTWVNTNRAYYEERGYQFTRYGEPLLVKSSDLPPSSAIRITALCDVCGAARSLRRSAYRDLCRVCVQVVAKNTPEQKALHSHLTSKRFESSGERERARQAAIRKWQRPEEHVKARIAQKSKWDKPGMREVYKSAQRRRWESDRGEAERHRCRRFMLGKVGPLNPAWKHDKSSEERVRGRNYFEYRQWRRSVFERDNYTCQLTGQRGCRLVAHHIESYADNPDLRVAVDNGVTWSKAVHDEFHRRYGKGRNTRAQYEEFIASYRAKEVSTHAA